VSIERIEEQRERVAGLEYEEWAERRRARDDDDAYEPDDAKALDYHDRHADVWDARGGK
jgi:hypothetical protein